MSTVKIPKGKEFKKTQAKLDGLGFFTQIKCSKISKKTYEYEVWVNYECHLRNKKRAMARKFIYELYLEKCQTQ